MLHHLPCDKRQETSFHTPQYNNHIVTNDFPLLYVKVTCYNMSL